VQTRILHVSDLHFGAGNAHWKPRVSEALGLPMSKVRAIATRIGGGFGGKAEPGTQIIAVAPAQATGRPVKVILSRGEDFTMMPVRQPTSARMTHSATRPSITPFAPRPMRSATER